MGNAHSSNRSAEFESASRAFSTSELGALKKLYISLAAQSRSEGKYVSASAFQAYFDIRGSLGTRLFDMVTQMRRDQCLYFEDLVIAKARYEKGGPAEVEEFMYQLLDLTGDGKVQRTELESVISSILVTVLDSKDGVAGCDLSDESLQAFLNAAEYSDRGEEPCLTMQDFRKLCSAIPSMKRFLASLLTPQPSGSLGRHIPNLLVPESMECSPLLKNEYAWHIAGPLQQQEAQEWVLLYNSSANGLSFNSFMGSVSKFEGPTVLIVKDKEGCIYGGYASRPWEKHSEFYGDMKSFLFALHPKISIHRPTGSNSNLQWCACNYVSESIPNGIGFGGQIHHYGLFVSGSFDGGHTHYSVTYGNPALSTKESIVPRVIECWAVVETKGDQAGEHGSQLKGTILERFKEDRQMLNMVGVANASHE